MVRNLLDSSYVLANGCVMVQLKQEIWYTRARRCNTLWCNLKLIVTWIPVTSASLSLYNDHFIRLIVFAYLTETI